MSQANAVSHYHNGNMKITGTLDVNNVTTRHDWQTYTPTVAGGTLPTTKTVNYFKFRIVGKSIHIRASVANTDNTGAVSTATYTFTFPSGCKLLADTASMSCGAAMLRSITSTKKYTGNTIIVATGSSPTWGLHLGNETSTPADWGNNSPAADCNLSTANGILWSADLFVELDPTSTILTTLSK